MYNLQQEEMNITGLIINRNSIKTDLQYAGSIAYDKYKYDKDNHIFRAVCMDESRKISYNEIAERAIKFSRLSEEPYLAIAQDKVNGYCTYAIFMCKKDSIGLDIFIGSRKMFKEDAADFYEFYPANIQGSFDNEELNTTQAIQVLDATSGSDFDIDEDSDEEEDNINNPKHYTLGKVECIDAIEGMLGEEGLMAFCLANAVKYIWRHRLKGKPIEDLEKAQWYINKAKETLKKIL